MKINALDNLKEAAIYKCFVDDVDVSHKCFAADDVEGWADCYVLDENSKVVVTEKEAVTERITGNVRLIPK